ncbi:transposase [Streptomyces sp. NRRL F-2664]|uniref:transposase n=1 Tax=Streptomyces sp. NRRL F-2664 TaxID=1463842 RepID=UPI000996B0AD|nr:transposase [Streptomyces sp. NRRL F-2664]
MITKLSAQHRAVDFRHFPDEIDRQTGEALAVDVICDKPLRPQGTRGAPVTPRAACLQLHFTPAYSSWINQVERWFAELERRCLERGVSCSLEDLKTALEG